MAEMEMAIPPRSDEPTVLIKNARRDTDTSQTEQLIRKDPRVKRLLNNKSWRGAAEAAIAFFIRGKECSVVGWKDTSTWKQVKTVYEELRRREPALPDVLAQNL